MMYCWLTTRKTLRVTLLQYPIKSPPSITTQKQQCTRVKIISKRVEGYILHAGETLYVIRVATI